VRPAGAQPAEAWPDGAVFLDSGEPPALRWPSGRYHGR